MQTQAEPDPIFVTTGYVTKEASGPLSVTALTPMHLLLIGFPWQAERVRAQLEAGEPLADVLGKLRSWQKVEARIPLEQLQAVSWIDDDLAVRIIYENERGRTRRKTTYIAEESDRERLLQHLQERLGRPVLEKAEPASIWTLGWAQALGAVVSMIGTIFFLAYWDPQAIARVRGGWLALLLGPVGCAFVGICFTVGCLVSWWWRCRHNPAEHRLVFR